MSSKSSYFLYASLLVMVIFPFSLAHATYPENLTVTSGSCSSGSATFSWDAPASILVFNWVNRTHDFSDGNPFISEEVDFSDPLPPGNYTVMTLGTDSNGNWLWYDPDDFTPSFTVSPGDTVTSYTVSGNISENDGGIDNMEFIFFADPANPNALTYDIRDNGTIIATTSDTSYTVTGFSPHSAHNYEVGTVVANQTSTVWWVPALSCPLPDLTADNTVAAPSPGMTGESESFSSNVYNSIHSGDNGADATNFPNIFQIVDSTMTNTIARVSAGTISSLAETPDWDPQPAPISGSYTFNTPGDYYVRACANMDTSGAIGVDEINPDDDCGDWEPLTITPPIPGCSTLTATPSTVDTGGTVHLTWSCQNVSSCDAISNTDGFTTNGHKNGSGSAVPLAPNDALTYGMTCDGTNFYFPPVAVVTPSVNISVNPARVRQAGATTTVSWTSSNVDPSSCSVKQNGTALSSGLNNGSTIATINSQTTFSISCSASGPTVTSSAAVNIAPGFLEF